ncbi:MULTISPECIES: hypothetical protein [Galbibacter]|uniref:Uncharacterized protein n=1 Tax=Galbibacter pacificus TaxID=2996052 RepID=A0ABT6FN88_9FLAO|nr:hypothetical protein [Galbibacter pacificus]MDG3581252.1 hypothetical protein [Galbibacter pacificus]MDG3584730.1 hypothetical protein [Galbibacter pacificus]
MKLLLKFFISLCVILISGFGQLYAHSSQDAVAYSSIRSLENFTHTNYCVLQDAHDPNAVSFSPGLEKRDHKIEITESEVTEEELISFKKDSEIADYLTSLWQLNAYKYAFLNNRKTTFLDKQTSYLSSFRWYIVFRVIRI